MSSLETTELKLRTTPTGGVSGEHSPYYRRLLSAGYKGFTQGTIAGAGLYGVMGLVIGGLVAVPAMIALGPAALTLIPAAGALGLFKGASTFGNIGTVAAITAESADMAEQRRYLLDRYYDLPDGPEGDKQAELIKNELAGLTQANRKHPLFHWKTVAVCAAIGGALALALFSPLGMELLAETPIAHLFTEIAEFATHHSPALAKLFVTATEAGAGEALAHGAAQAVTLAPGPMLSGLGAAVGVGLGALTGAAVGVDRHYIRKWFDGSEKLLHDDAHTREAMHARAMQVERLREAARIDNQTKLILQRRNGLNNTDEPNQSTRVTAPGNAGQTPAPDTPKLPIASLDAAPPSLEKTANDNAPETSISSAKYEHRLADIQQAMKIPTV